MLDFQNSLFAQLRSVSNAEFSDMATPLLIPGEQILHTFKSRHEGVIFTNMRILAVNIHGLGGKKNGFYLSALQQNAGLYRGNRRPSLPGG